MEKYPVPTKCRLALNEPGNNSSNGPTLLANNDVGTTNLAQLRSKLRPPSVTIARPISIQLNKSGIDTNGNIPRPSSLPRLIKVDSGNVTARMDSLQAKPPAHQSTTGLASTKTIPFRAASLDSKNRTILNPPPVSSNNKSVSTASKDSQTGSISPSPSTMSIASSFGSNQSHSVADSGIATCSSSRSPTVSEKKSALSLKFGFYNKKPFSATDMKKATVDRINSANSGASPSASGHYSSVKLRTPSANEQNRQAKQRPTSLRISSSAVTAAIQRASSSKIQPSPAKLPTPQLTLIKNRAAQVLSRSRSTEYKSVELKPRLSVEAIVASLEQEIRHQLGPEPPPLSAPVKEPAKTTIPTTVPLQVERFGVDPGKAEIAFVNEDDEDFIEDIELQLQTPSSAAECHPSP